VHIAPPASRVPFLMADLFEWLTQSKDHLLIKSCVFHYEFEFIHPFSDGNGRLGRLGRLWQSLILSELHPISAYLPVENMVFQNQQRYYDAIGDATTATDSQVFIEFMLGEILMVLKRRQGVALKVNDTVNDTVNDVLRHIQSNPKTTIDEIAAHLQKSRSTVNRVLKQLRAAGAVERVGSDKVGFWIVAKCNL
jgi:Fic family protein